MRDYLTETVGLKIHRQHVVAALLAGLMSLCAHLAFVINFAELPIGFARLISPVKKELPRREAVELGTVELEPPPSIVEPDRLTFVEQAIGSPAAERVEKLARPPEQTALEPPPSEESRLATETGNLQEAAPAAERAEWQPRQEIIAIEERIIKDDVALLARRVVPSIERVAGAPDVTSPISRAAMLEAIGKAAGADDVAEEKPVQAVIEGGAVAPRETTSGDPKLVIGEAAAYDPVNLFQEKPAEVTSYMPLEKLLKASMFTYTTLRDLKHGYFRIEITRIDSDVLPVLPKDIVFVQDCSASMTEQRVYFCRQGLLRNLVAIGEADRFNVIAFKDKAELCFPDWSANTPAARKRAEAFIEGMTAGGETDILTSLKVLSDLKLQSGRPAIALMVTDGRSTTGTTAASQIIREFSRLNEGRISVFTMGTIQTANSYLLDILSYCNRGDTRLVATGRWGIPDTMAGLMLEVSRPVLGEVGFRFPKGAEIEVYPVQTMNLYSDRPLILYGRYNRDAERVIFQAAGTAGGKRCDMIFDMPIDDAQESRDKTLRSEWGRQKVYHLVGEYARTGDPSLLRQIDETARAYRVPVPHRGEF